MRVFGATAAGEAVHAIDLAAGDLRATVLTRGAILHDVRLRGVDRNLTVSSGDLAQYDGSLIYHGAVVAPVANRIKGAYAVIDGQERRFEANQRGNILHSAGAGTNLKVWEVVGEAPNRAVLALTLPDGEGGFPGTRRVRATFEVLAPAALRLTIEATTDRPTLWSAVNHSYWNLDGSPTWEGHALRIAADRYVPVDDSLIPTGEVRAVAGTPYDFREGRAPRPGAPPLDHNFCVGDAPGPLRDVLWLTGASGVAMALATTEPGVQVYDGSQGARPGAALFEALAIEAQMWPDAPSNPGFPSIALGPGEARRQVTEWRFSRP